ncbi:Tof1p KNAG_0F00450 [Huiozyma naganishii CBS 8797]|uniref:Topoisomerase 1-associated factor 1 n=1 Tax=Huiozyma naganishii (strain ATCC MYA-139 / BCRC 22969 / CBS 8797 / KCTC 17520 / NBRC 10181 / NCYC 3082 / Yp74L-3) TaxID=1071383 RepID=J7S715_HUIN7|nr:hypothetical protein KNAG_0F00450 [Kazachstania naganishii CBS 8797]CCK70714.1 hypothetical protein KNAG_0F00450 [Kazachstania naganishii CBS 8797]
MESDDTLNVLRARIALLATAIGGPDYNSQLDPLPYKLGDDCLACLKDLKRWFKLVDDKQNTWEVAMAAAEFKVLTDDLVPILVDWEEKCSLEAKLTKKNKPSPFRNKSYYDKVALQCLQLLVLMTWPLIITEHSSASQVNVYTDLKKHQLLYKKAILSTQQGKVLKAVIRLVLNVMKIDRLSRTPRDNLTIKLALNFFRNVLSIEPGELMITTKKKPSATKGISSVDTLPPNVSMDDISLNAVINSFERNKVFKLLLTLSNSVNTEFDPDFIIIPVLEIMFYLTKDINPRLLFSRDLQSQEGKDTRQTGSKAGNELSNLLSKEFQMKKNLIKNTSSRHSRFGTLLSVETPEKIRLTVSGSQNILDESKALQKLDSRKKWSKRTTRVKDDPLEKGLPNSLLNSQQTSYLALQSGATLKSFLNFIDNFLNSSFNIVLHGVTNYMTTEQDKLVIIEQIEYLLFYSWFIQYQILKCSAGGGKPTDTANVSEALKETSFILASHLLRSAFEMKNWIVVHAGMIAFNELLSLLNYEKGNPETDKEDIEFIISKLFSGERIHLLSNLPRMANRHTPQYMKSCIDLTHSVLKTLELYTSDERHLVVEGKKTRRKNASKNTQLTNDSIERTMELYQVDRDEAIDILDSQATTMDVNFHKVQNAFINEATVETYINFLQRFRELDDDQIKKIISFFHRVFVQAKEESFLFRFDLIVLLQEMLSDDGLARNARVRKHVDQFANYYLQRLKNRLKKFPSWAVHLLFPALHDMEIGYFQKYGERKAMKKNNFYGAPPSIIKPFPEQEQLPANVLKDMSFGVLVSTLIDDSKTDLLDLLAQHMSKSLDIFRSWLTVNIEKETETENPPNQKFSVPDDIGNPLLFDKDFRALLKLIGYSIPSNQNETCYLPGLVEISELNNSFQAIKKYTTTTFETPNGQPSSTYLIRPRNTNDDSPFDNNGEDDGWTGHDSYDLNDPSIVRDEEVDDNEYFKDLERGGTTSTYSTNTAKGIAAKKSKKKQGKAGNKIRNGDESGSRRKREPPVVSSKEYIDSDDDDDDNAFDSIFFENEIYLRWIMNRSKSQLTPEQHSMFGKFVEERIRNNGLVNGDYSDLFGGAIPSLNTLKALDTSESLADKTLLNLSSKMEAETNYLSSDSDSSDENVKAVSNDKETLPVLPSTANSEESDSSNILSEKEYYSAEFDTNTHISSKESLKRKNDTSDEDEDDAETLLKSNEKQYSRTHKKRLIVAEEDEDD